MSPGCLRGVSGLFPDLFPRCPRAVSRSVSALSPGCFPLFPDLFPGCLRAVSALSKHKTKPNPGPPRWGKQRVSEQKSNSARPRHTAGWLRRRHVPASVELRGAQRCLAALRVDVAALELGASLAHPQEDLTTGESQSN